MITLFQVNALTPADFMVRFGDVAEHSPWVAEEAMAKRPFASRDAMVDAFASALDGAAHTARLSLIRAHPDLATKAKLTDDSTREQAGAGLDTLTPEEFGRFTILNDTYKSKFGFPFIFAVRGATKQQILESFEKRVLNDVETEFAMAISQISRIFRFRIEDRVAP
jgi:2-oxo-4-hydroxy-4-carboxy-5-ureidoimidazoline decarboxylase